MESIRQLLAIRHANGVRARTPWNNEQLVRLLPPYAEAFSLSFNTPDDCKALRDDGAAAPTPPYLICTTPRGQTWTYVHATPGAVLRDEIIARPDEAFVVHMWPDASSRATHFRMHKRGTQVVSISMRGIRPEDPADLIRFEATAFGPGSLRDCRTLGDSMGRLLDRVGVGVDRGSALVAGGDHLRLTCDPADIDSVTIIHLRPWTAELDG